MSTKQYPDVGLEITCTPSTSDYPVVDVKLTKMLGAARLYEVVLTSDCDDCKAGDVGVFAIQPDGKWWMVRDFVDPNEKHDEDWRQ